MLDYKKQHVFSYIPIIFVYVLLFFAVGLAVGYKETLSKAQLKTLNRLRPVSFTSLSQTQGQLKAKELDPYLFYFQKVAEYAPEVPEAYAVLGYAQFKTAQHKKAYKNFQKSVKLDDNFFWNLYNMGILEFKNGRFEQAAALFEQALAADRGYAIKKILSSKVYLPIAVDYENPQEIILSNLRQGYVDVLEMLAVCYYKMNDYRKMLKAASLGFSANDVKTQSFFSAIMGIGFYYTKDYQKAGAMLENVIKSESVSAEVCHYMGLVLTDLRKISAADQFFAMEKQLETKGQSLFGHAQSLTPQIF